MKETYAQLHRGLLAEIGDCLNQDQDEKKQSENGFHIAMNYGQQLKQLMKRIDFEDEDEEIDFFRNVKPQFACYIEYFTVINTALSFVPANREDVIEFWLYERDRLQRFCEQHRLFVSYYENEQHHSDKLYFLRENNELKFIRNLYIYDTDIEWCTSHDRLVRNYLAYKMYSEYCGKKLLEQLSVDIGKSEIK